MIEVILWDFSVFKLQTQKSQLLMFSPVVAVKQSICFSQTISRLLLNPNIWVTAFLGGENVFIWLAEHNAELIGFDLGRLSTHKVCHLGSVLWSEQRDRIKYPLKFSFDPGAVYEDLPAATDCPLQGFVP